jgi:hypothetical protein
MVVYIVIGKVSGSFGDDVAEASSEASLIVGERSMIQNIK